MAETCFGTLICPEETLALGGLRYVLGSLVTSLGHFTAPTWPQDG